MACSGDQAGGNMEAQMNRLDRGCGGRGWRWGEPRIPYRHRELWPWRSNL